jgi:hypothetical protein
MLELSINALQQKYIEDSGLIVYVCEEVPSGEVLDAIEEVGLRTSVIVYSAANVDLFPFEHGESTWQDRRLRTRDSYKMANAIKIGYAVKELLRKLQTGIKRSCIRMDTAESNQ